MARLHEGLGLRSLIRPGFSVVAMKFSTHWLAALTAVQLSFTPLQGEDLPGKWSAPPERGGSVLHEGTNLAFPPKLVGYELAGIFDFATEEGMFVRYVNADQRSRADIFLFPLQDKPESVEAKRKVIVDEIDAVIFRLQDMAESGVYKDIEVGELKVGEIELWKEEALPLGSREVKATRIANSEEGTQQAEILQWTGATVYRDYVITIRHLRPQDSGEAGKGSMDAFVTAVVQLIKDPSLQKEVTDRLKLYLADPLGPSAVEHTAVVLAYLNQSLAIPTLVPAPPLTTWLDEAEKEAKGTRDTLAHAFVMGHTNYILANPDAEMDVRLEAACAQLIAVYELLKQRQPEIQQPQLDELQKAVSEGKGAAFIKERT